MSVATDDTPQKKYAKRVRKYLDEESALALPTRRKVWDFGPHAARGLMILIQPSGTKTYRAAFQYENGKQGATKIGRVGEVSLDDARKRTREIRSNVAASKAPVRKAEPLSFKQAMEDWTRLEQIGRKENASARPSCTC